jgi:hypothetical protein
VIAYSLPPLVEMYVSYGNGLKLVINDVDYYDVVYSTVMLVYLSVLASGYKTVFIYN